MKIVERVLAIIVGQEMSPEELTEVSGGKEPPKCPGGQKLTIHGCEDI